MKFKFIGKLDEGSYFSSAYYLLLFFLFSNAIGSFFYVKETVWFFSYWTFGCILIFALFYIPYLIVLNTIKEKN